MVDISLCMIVRDEEANLGKCLESIAGYMDEIIIVDTGSTDLTKEVAHQYTDKVYDFTWVNDFSAARNYSISKAKNEYILVIDSDEILESIEIDKIKASILDHPFGIGRLLRINEFSREGNSYQYQERVNRLFSKKLYRYEAVIHEQLVPIGSESRTPYEYGNTYPIPLTIRHAGYEGDLTVRKRKTERNIELLKIALEKNPEDPYLLYQLGKSYYMEGNYPIACDYFGQALYFDLNPKLEYVQDMVENYGYALINAKRYETALLLLNVYEEFAVTADFVYLAGLIYMNNGAFHEAIEEFKKATTMSYAKMDGVNSYRALYNIGVIYECLGKLEVARDYYKICGNFPNAVERLMLTD